MKTLFLAWQDQTKTRAWYPIGRLDANPSTPLFRFCYVQGAEKAHREAGFQPLDSFPDFHERYEDKELFPLFRNRLVAQERVDFAEYVERLGLSPATADPIEILAVSEGTRQTDNLEVFPRIQRHRDATFCCRFFLHGWRHVSAAAQERIRLLQPGDSLRIAVELNNPVTTVAVQVETTEDYLVIGWTPRYLIHDLVRTIDESPLAISATVARLNPEPAPSKQRVLIELRGHWPAHYKPMDTPEFHPLVH
jgi:hypothetical protein